MAVRRAVLPSCIGAYLSVTHSIVLLLNNIFWGRGVVMEIYRVLVRPEERGVGKGGRSRGPPYH